MNAAHDFQHLLEHLTHILPEQAPLRDFVHHNTLHGLQHLPFPQALKAAHEITGAYGYWPADKFRGELRRQRITQADLQAVLAADPSLASESVVFAHAGGEVRRGDIYRVALTHAIKSITPSQLVWEVEENKVLDHDAERWAACLAALHLEHHWLHSEDLLNFSPQRAIRLFAAHLEAQNEDIAARVIHDAQALLLRLTQQVGEKLTLRGLLYALTGEDILHDIRPLLLRQVASWLDQGVATWHNTDAGAGFFQAWRNTSKDDLLPELEELPDWQEHLLSLPDTAAEAIVAELQRIGIPREHWDGYLERLALELPGWSGMFLWRHFHPHYVQTGAASVDMLDYLAVRLSMEHLFARRLCRRIWWMEASLGDIRGRFRRHPAEFLVRYYTFNHDLPEYLLTPAQQLMHHNRPRVYAEEPWELLAHQIWTWVQLSGVGEGYTVYNHAWRLFRLMQYLGVDAASIRSLSDAEISVIFTCLETLDDEQSGFLWLQAYERHYREQIFNALVNNHR
ncbi:MAG: putative inorganic carbon transporter subunit DabA, partial [Thiothrix sp.]